MCVHLYVIQDCVIIQENGAETLNAMCSDSAQFSVLHAKNV